MCSRKLPHKSTLGKRTFFMCKITEMSRLRGVSVLAISAPLNFGMQPETE